MGVWFLQIPFFWFILDLWVEDGVVSIYLDIEWRGVECSALLPIRTRPVGVSLWVLPSHGACGFAVHARMRGVVDGTFVDVVSDLTRPDIPDKNRPDKN